LLLQLLLLLSLPFSATWSTLNQVVVVVVQVEQMLLLLLRVLLIVMMVEEEEKEGRFTALPHVCCVSTVVVVTVSLSQIKMG